MHRTDSFPEQVDTIVRPNDLDILCGSGKIASMHPGNQRFQAIVKKHYTSYVTAQCCKKTKMHITYNVMAEIMSSGCTRFLKKHPHYDRYYVAHPRVGKDKVTHCLREMKASRARQVRSRRQFQSPLLRNQYNTTTSSPSSDMIYRKEELTLQGSSSFHEYSALQQPSMEENMLQRGLKTVVPESIAASDTFLSAEAHPTNQQLDFGSMLSCATTAATTTTTTTSTSAATPPTLAPIPRPAHFETTSQWWLESGSFSSSCAGTQHRQPQEWFHADAESFNAQEIPDAAGLNSPVGILFSNFCWELQEEHQEDALVGEKQQEQEHHQELVPASDPPLLLCQQSSSFGDPAVLSFNVLQLQQQQQRRANEIIDHFILDTLKLSGKEDKEQIAEDHGEGVPTSTAFPPLLDVELTASLPSVLAHEDDAVLSFPV